MIGSKDLEGLRSTVLTLKLKQQSFFQVQERHRRLMPQSDPMSAEESTGLSADTSIQGSVYGIPALSLMLKAFIRSAVALTQGLSQAVTGNYRRFLIIQEIFITEHALHCRKPPRQACHRRNA